MRFAHDVTNGSMQSLGFATRSDFFAQIYCAIDA
jgi:hypothetical protein